MRRVSLFLALVAVLVVSAALPVGAAAPITVPLTVDCGEGDIVVDIIEAQGSLVGFVDGDAVVIHAAHVFETDTVTLESGPQEFEVTLDLVAGMGRGIQGMLTECTFEDATLFHDELGLLDARVERQLLRFFPGLVIQPDDYGQPVTVSGVGSGTVWLQFPGN